MTLGRFQSYEERYAGGSQSYIKFQISFYRSNLLKSVAIASIETEIEKLEGIVSKLSEAKDSNGTSDSKESKNKNEKLVAVELNEDQFEFLSGVMNFTHKEHVILDTYLYSVLVVFLWGAFETYITSVFNELFHLKPSMLKSNETLRYEEVIDNLNDPLKLIMNKELNKIGHFKLKEYIEYLKNKINVKFEDELESTLSEIYLIRNIIAHNTGKVRDDFVKLLPKEIKTIDNEIIVTTEYFEKAKDTISNSVEIIEKMVRDSFFKKQIDDIV
ncbi:hypothetical protein GXP70_07885 [Paenibacillus lycopersici]|uniref:RiboL-PSP-HEPN domain-containing protein n=1 Tax=Paenibacillus lycopersici TaxID=2704462 RepID=A0A6C0FSP6_9BACL|nr:hypothetical protein [Paenibacillus lycopersici]QHT59877.1 hypothetical protein GXP70_07885 [Paenibacillus lycopersici]